MDAEQMDLLERLARLRELGAISRREFAREKEAILRALPRSVPVPLRDQRFVDEGLGRRLCLSSGTGEDQREYTVPSARRRAARREPPPWRSGMEHGSS